MRNPLLKWVLSRNSFCIHGQKRGTVHTCAWFTYLSHAKLFKCTSTKKFPELSCCSHGHFIGWGLIRLHFPSISVLSRTKRFHIESMSTNPSCICYRRHARMNKSHTKLCLRVFITFPCYWKEKYLIRENLTDIQIFQNATIHWTIFGQKQLYRTSFDESIVANSLLIHNCSLWQWLEYTVHEESFNIHAKFHSCVQ